jgi:hypothetical protein
MKQAIRPQGIVNLECYVCLRPAFFFEGEMTTWDWEHPLLCYTHRRDRVLFTEEAGWAPQ